MTSLKYYSSHCFIWASNPINTGIYRAVDNIFRLIDGISNGRFAIVGDGTTVKTTAYVKNFTAAIRFLSFQNLVLTSSIPDEPPLTMNEMTSHIANKLRIGRKLKKIPYYLASPIAKLFDFAVRLTGINFPITKARIDTFLRHTNFSSEKLRNMGFKQPIDTYTALDQTVSWYQKLKIETDDNFFGLGKSNETRINHGYNRPDGSYFAEFL